MEYQGRERRKNKRIRHRFTTKLRIFPEGEDGASLKWDIATMRDLSTGGIAFHYAKKIPLGTVIEFTIPLSFNETPIHCLGSVCRIDESTPSRPGKKNLMYGVAARFTTIDDDKREAITQLILSYA